MFNLLLSLITGILIGWSFHAFFVELHEPNIIKSEFNLSTSNTKVLTVKEELKVKSPKKEPVLLTKKTVEDPFYGLLKQNLFSDAIALYTDSKKEKQLIYAEHLLNYFHTKSKTNPQETLFQMFKFIELLPNEKEIAFELLKLYKEEKEHQLTINLLLELIDTSSASELETLHLDLVQTSQQHINKLKSLNEFSALVAFLEKHIELGVQASFYTYSLAQYYVETKDYVPAIELLKEIEFDEEYGEKAKKLLALIDNKIKLNSEYEHKINLVKVGEHFGVNVTINDTELTLLLDTGATVTMLNEEKVSSLRLIKEDIILETAGGELEAKLQESDTLTMGNIELNNFQVVTSSFEQKNADGLLGMNFFKEFKFKIDQDEEVLYLSKIETVVK